MSEQPKAVSLLELLRGVPKDARLITDHGPFETSYEPVGRYCHEAADEIERLGNLCYDYIGELTALRAAKQMQQRIDELKGQREELETVYETIVHWDEGGGKRSRRELARRIVGLFPGRPEWQGLTEEEVMNFYMFWVVDLQDIIGFYKAIERKLKERNK